MLPSHMYKYAICFDSRRGSYYICPIEHASLEAIRDQATTLGMAMDMCHQYEYGRGGTYISYGDYQSWIAGERQRPAFDDLEDYEYYQQGIEHRGTRAQVYYNLQKLRHGF